MITSTPSGGLDTVMRTVERRLLVSTLAGAAIVGGWGLAPPDIVEPAVSSTSRLLLNLAVAAALAVLVAVPWTRVASRRLLAPLRAWAENDEPATDAEVRRILTQPLRQAAWIMPIWVVVAVVVPAVNIAVVYAPGTYPLVRVELQLAVAAFIAFALAHAQVEDAIRPLVGRALTERPAVATGRHGLTTWALLLWGAVAGAPLASIAILVGGLERADLIEGRPAIVLLATIGLLVGGAVSAFASRPVLRGLNEARAGVDAVARGYLHVSLPADRPDEVGALHAGFNQMVAELRERQRIEELFGRYLGVAAADLEDPMPEGGRPCRATILVADVIGSSRLAIDLDPEVVVAMLNDFFHALGASVDEEGGWVERFEGDGAVCVFGAPAVQPDHAARAVRAAQALRRRLVELAEVHPRLDAAIGVATGDMFAATLGAADRQTYALVGTTNAEAAQLCELAKRHPDRIRTSPETDLEATGVHPCADTENSRTTP